jgi:hypothetical protein
MISKFPRKLEIGNDSQNILTQQAGSYSLEHAIQWFWDTIHVDGIVTEVVDVLGLVRTQLPMRTYRSHGPSFSNRRSVRVIVTSVWKREFDIRITAPRLGELEGA